MVIDTDPRSSGIRHSPRGRPGAGRGDRLDGVRPPRRVAAGSALGATNHTSDRLALPRGAIARVPPVSASTSSTSVLPVEQYMAGLSRKRMAAGVLFRDRQGRVLLLEPSYKPNFGLVARSRPTSRRGRRPAASCSGNSGWTDRWAEFWPSTTSVRRTPGQKGWCSSSMAGARRDRSGGHGPCRGRDPLRWVPYAGRGSRAGEATARQPARRCTGGRLPGRDRVVRARIRHRLTIGCDQTGRAAALGRRPLDPDQPAVQMDTASGHEMRRATGALEDGFMRGRFDRRSVRVFRRGPYAELAGR